MTLRNFNKVEDFPLEIEFSKEDLFEFDVNYNKVVGNKQKFVNPMKFTRLLRQGSLFRNLKTFYKGNLTYLYNPKEGVYMLVSRKFMGGLLYRIGEEMGVSDHLSLHYRKETIENLEDATVNKSRPIEDPYLIFDNGAFHLDTKELSPWTPSIFCLNRLPYKFDPTLECPEFMSFMNFCFKDDPLVIELIRAFFWALLYRFLDAQMFIFLLGPGGTGKSTLANVARALVGDTMALTTTLKDLHNDRFEALNLVGKRLILISDTEYYQGDMSILKAITGGDLVRGRVKYVQGSIEVIPEGLLLITGNQPLGTRDAGGAISRRARVVLMDNRPDEFKNMLSYDACQGWAGLLSKELPGIFNWAIRIQPKDAKEILINTHKMIPSMGDQHRLTQEELNPLVAWYRTHIINDPDSGSYQGFVTSSGKEKLISEGSKRKTLYPAYVLYMKQRGLTPVNHNRFSRELLDVCKSEGAMGVSKVRRAHGSYFHGLVLREGVFDKDYLMGSPLPNPD